MRNIDARRVAQAQGLLYVTTGVWPLLSMGTFEAVTGRKRDDWLVRTVGLVLAVIGGALLEATAEPDAQAPPRPVRHLGVATALALAAIDVRYAVPGRIRRVYLLDAAAELALAVAWTQAGGKRR